MIDLSNVKAPGWQRIVAELNSPAPDDRSFLERLVRILAQVSAARQAVLFAPDRTDGEEIEPRAEHIYPPQALNPGGGVGESGGTESGARPRGGKGGAAAAAVAGSNDTPDNSGVEFAKEARDAARAAFSTGQARAFALDNKGEMYYDAAPSQGCVLSIPLLQAVGAPNARGEQQVSIGGVITLLLEQRSKDAVRSTLAMAEVIAGYVAGHAARSQLKRTQAASMALDLATRLIASVNTAKAFKGATIQLVNDLAKQFSLDRVALGWVKGDQIKVKAISDTEHFDQRLAMVQKLQAAMDECLDQEQAVLYPAPAGDGPEGDVLLSQAIVHAHRELASGNAGLQVCSIPLRAGEEVVGVLTFELSTADGQGRLELGLIELLQAAMDLVGPVMELRRSADRNVALRAADDSVKAAGWLVGPKHTVWKLAGVAVIALFTFVTFYQTTYRPSAEATIDPRTRRLVSVPFDGTILRLSDAVESGSDVREGDLLIQLDTSELELGLADSRAKIEQARTQIAAAQREGDQGKVKQGQSQLDRAVAEADLYEYRINKSRILAPISGRVVAGDLKDKLGASVKLGETLLQIADVSDLIVTAKVEEADIRFVRDAFEAGMAGGVDAGKSGTGATGDIATKADPGRPLSFEVEKIVPLAQAADGKNRFEVRARLKDTPENRALLKNYTLVVGMEGIAKFDTQRHSLLWIGTRKLIDTARLWLW